MRIVLWFIVKWEAFPADDMTFGGSSWYFGYGEASESILFDSLNVRQEVPKLIVNIVIILC